MMINFTGIFSISTFQCRIVKTLLYNLQYFSWILHVYKNMTILVLRVYKNKANSWILQFYKYTANLVEFCSFTII